MVFFICLELQRYAYEEWKKIPQIKLLPVCVYVCLCDNQLENMYHK